MVRAGLGDPAVADAAQLATVTQAECLRELEQAGAVATAARALFLAAFSRGRGTVIHQQGWILVLNPDGTTIAWNKDRTKVLHSHGPPARAG